MTERPSQEGLGEDQQPERETALALMEERGEEGERARAPAGTEGPLPIEDGPQVPPVGHPESFGPRSLQPLFDAEQVRRAEDLVKKSPLLNANRTPSPGRELGWDGGAQMTTGRVVPRAIEDALMRGPRAMGALPAIPAPMTAPPPPGFSAGIPPYVGWPEEQARAQWQMTSEMQQLSYTMRQLQEENLRLKMQLMEEREVRYSTPPDGTDASLKKDEEHAKDDRRKEGSSKDGRKEGPKKKVGISRESTGGKPKKMILDGPTEAREQLNSGSRPKEERRTG